MKDIFRAYSGFLITLFTIIAILLIAHVSA